MVKKEGSMAQDFHKKSDEKEMYKEIFIKSHDRFDKYILYLSTGAFVLSLTFLERITSSPLPHTLGFLFCSWILLLLSMLFILLSFYTSAESARAYYEAVIIEENNPARNAKLQRGEACARWTKCLNCLAFIMLFLGLFFLVGFVCMGLSTKT